MERRRTDPDRRRADPDRRWIDPPRKPTDSPRKPTDPTRRRVLAATAGGLGAALAGCPSMDAPPESGDATSDGDSTSPTPSRAPTGTDGPTDAPTGTRAEGDQDTTTAAATATPELDLREANVVGVAVTPDAEGYRFDVTLYHDDDGEAGYADWWQVEIPDGERLGRRDLLHAHGTRPFARSETISLPDGVSCVVVRGHDRSHGYGGQAMVVTVASGATRPVQQGPEPRSFADAACP